MGNHSRLGPVSRDSGTRPYPGVDAPASASAAAKMRWTPRRRSLRKHGCAAAPHVLSHFLRRVDAARDHCSAPRAERSTVRTFRKSSAREPESVSVPRRAREQAEEVCFALIAGRLRGGRDGAHAWKTGRTSAPPYAVLVDRPGEDDFVVVEVGYHRERDVAYVGDALVGKLGIVERELLVHIALDVLCLALILPK
jgi:hypothetical protein